MKEHSELSSIVMKYREYKEVKQGIAEAREMIEEGDDDIKELAKLELSELEGKVDDLRWKLKSCYCLKIQMMKEMLY